METPLLSVEWRWFGQETEATERVVSAAILDRSTSDYLSVLNARTQRLDGYVYKLLGGNSPTNQFGFDVIISDQQFDIDEKRMAIRFPIASGRARDGVGDLLEVGGIRLERHKSNPCVLLDHGKYIQLPIAMAEDPETGQYTVEIDQANQVAHLKAFFYQSGKDLGGGKDYDHSVFCAQVFDLACKKFLRGGSIGYQILKGVNLPPDYEKGTPAGLHLLSILMLEGSLVVMPANADTVRKCLDMPSISGQRPGKYLVKSLTPYTTPKKAQLGYEARNYKDAQVVPVPLNDDLSRTNIPPVKWKPGMGAVKDAKAMSHLDNNTGGALPPPPAQGMRKKRRRCDLKALRQQLHYKAKKGQVERVMHEYKEGTLKSSSGQPVSSRAQALAIALNVAGLSNKKDKALIADIKGSDWFKTCPRDETGHCLPQGQGGAGKKKPAPAHDLKKGEGRSGDTSSGPEHKLAAKYKITIKPNQPEADAFAEAKKASGYEVLKVKEDKEKKRWLVYWVPGKAAVTNQKSLRSKGKDMAAAMKMKTKAAPPVEEPLDETPLEETPPDEGEVPEEVPGEAEGDEPGVEPYGAQVLRRIHQNSMILMEEYHEMLGPLEHDGVKGHLQKQLEHLEEVMTETEGMFKKEYKELPEIEGAMDEEEGLQETPESDEVEATSGGEEEVPAEEVAAGMQTKTLDAARVKDLRKQIRKKSACPKCGKENCECGNLGVGDTGKDRPHSEARREENKKALEGAENQAQQAVQDYGLLPHHHEHIGAAATHFKTIADLQPGAWNSEHAKEAYHHGRTLKEAADHLGQGASMSGAVKKFPLDREDDKAEVSKKKGFDELKEEDKEREVTRKKKDFEEINAMDDRAGVQPGDHIKSWHKALTDASGHMNKLSGQSALMPEDQQMAMVHHEHLKAIGVNPAGASDEGQLAQGTGEVGSVNTKALQEACARQYEEMRKLNEQMVNLHKLRAQRA